MVGDCTDLSQFPDGRFDVVFASNLVEHLDRDAVDRLVDESHRVLAPGGRLILLQPNFRLAPGRYFDDYTHVSIWTDQSLGDFLRSRGWAARGGLPAVPAVDPEVARCRADLPRPVVPPVAGQAAGRPDARGRPPMTWRDKTLCVVLPTYNERDSIAECIRRFEALPEVDEVLVVNNNAAPGTSEEVATTGAREVLETRQGYGAAIQRGLMETDADLVCLCEPDGTFDPEDLRKLLAFMPECDLVVGSRTVATFIWDGANMGWFLRWGNWGVAKSVEVLHNTTSLSDVGCTFRVMTREVAQRVLPRSTVSGSAYGLEMMLLAAILKIRMVQVPVNYRPRVGVSSVTGDRPADPRPRVTDGRSRRAQPVAGPVGAARALG